MDKSTEERLATLEAKVAAQEAQIDGLSFALADLLAAHAVLHKDVRLFTLLKQYMNSDYKAKKQGGTTQIPAGYFAERCNALSDLLEKVYASQIFDNYWYRRVFWRLKKERSFLEKIRKSADAVISE